MRPRLVIVAGPSRGAQVALETKEVVLGRDSGCEVCLPDATLSRRHAALVRTSEGWRLRDLGSLNGIRVNGLSAADHLLAAGDKIELGSSVLVFRPEGPEEASSPERDLPAPAALSTIRLPLSEAVFAGDEVTLAASTKTPLLRVLDTRSFERVGGTDGVKVDVRVVAATNRDLPEEVRQKRLREELCYRLAVVTITLPPLRERREDIPALASFFLARHSERLGRHLDGFLPADLGRLAAYGWP